MQKRPNKHFFIFSDHLSHQFSEGIIVFEIFCIHFVSRLVKYSIEVNINKKEKSQTNQNDRQVSEKKNVFRTGFSGKNKRGCSAFFANIVKGKEIRKGRSKMSKFQRGDAFVFCRGWCDGTRACFGNRYNARFASL